MRKVKQSQKKHTFDFILNPLFLDISTVEVTFDNNYRYNAISIELIFD